MNKQTVAKEKNFVGIQYLRGLSALLVVLLHATQMAGMSKYFNENPFNRIFMHGFIGVDIFFCISGFIIFQSTISEKNWTPKISIKEYISRRFFRVIPFMWTATLLYAALRFITLKISDPTLLIQSLTLIPGIDIQPNVLWTLRHELIFYLLFGLIFFKKKIGWIPLITWTSLPVFLHLLNIETPIDGRQTLYPLVGNVNTLFAFGIITAIINNKTTSKKTKLLEKSNIPLLTALIALYIAAFELNYNRDTILPVLIMGIACSALLLISTQIQESNSNNRLGKILKILGDASYSIYLTHSMLLSFSLKMTTPISKLFGINIASSLSIIVAIIGGILTSKFIEKPLIRFIKKTFQQTRSVDRESPQST